MARSSASFSSSLYIEIVFVLLLVNMLFSITFAEIRTYQIDSKLYINSIDNDYVNKALFIDSFQFTNRGRIEINVSEIFLSNLNLNFSKFGFFVIPRYTNRIVEKSIAGYSFDKLSKDAKSFDFVFGQDNMVFDSSREEDYILYFINNFASSELQFSMVVTTSMYNLELDSSSGIEWTKRNYLSASKVLLPRIHFGFVLLYLCLIFISLRKNNVYIKIKKQQGNRLLCIQITILVVLIIKVLSLLCELFRNIFIKHFGYSQGFFLAMLAYGSVLFSEVPLATLTTLINCGWSYLKPSLNLKLKIILVSVIIFHTALNVDALKYTQIRPNCESCHLCLHLWWALRVILDTAVIIYCAHSSYYFLRESGSVEGKARSSLLKINMLKKFFHFCFILPCVKSLYTVYQSESTIWAVVFLGEAITFSFYVFVDYMFRSDLPSLNVRIRDDLEYAAADILDRADVCL